MSPSALPISENASWLRRFFARFNITLPLAPVAPPTHQPLTSTLLQLAILIGLAIGFHFTIADSIIAGFALFVYLLKLVFISGKTKRTAPPQLMIMALTIVCVGLIIMLYGGWNGQRAGISFLVLLVSLKFLESRTLRDYYVVCLILYFLAASSFLFNASILNISIIMVYTLAVTGIMLKLSSPNSINWHATVSFAGGIVTKALPIALLLFLFFPRISGNFGFIPGLENNQFDSELSNSLVAGDIAASAFNNRLAFRVEFDDEIPPSNQLYWRSKVMPFEDNFTWAVRSPSPNDLRNASSKLGNLSKLPNEDNFIRYLILHEASTDIFLPYLDYVTNFSLGTFLDDYSIWQRQPLGRSFSYRGSSIVSANITEPNQINTAPLLQTTSQPTARIQRLLREWQQQTTSPTELAQVVLNHFNQDQFAYSLAPPGLDEFNPIDDFLFNTKTGYCEHYASVFTTVMRWLGVPARVVVGYQGGLTNQSGEYLEVRYSDAHAWSEILVNQQWIRVDPTAAISPERIEFGMDAFMSAWQSDSDSFSGASLSNYLNPGGINKYYRLIGEQWKNIGYQWNKWIVNYNADTQKELLSNLGIETQHTYRYLVLILSLGIGSFMIFYFWRLLPKRVKKGEAQELYLKFVRQFKNSEVIKNASDTPYEFATKASLKCPQKKEDIDEITKAYVQLRYSKSGFDLVKFKHLINNFKLAK